MLLGLGDVTTGPTLEQAAQGAAILAMTPTQAYLAGQATGSAQTENTLQTGFFPSGAAYACAGESCQIVQPPTGTASAWQSFMNTINANPVILIGGAAMLALLLGGKRR